MLLIDKNLFPLSNIPVIIMNILNTEVANLSDTFEAEQMEKVPSELFVNLKRAVGREVAARLPARKYSELPG
jgi:hypothetical protein